ncbi:ABC transporter substrate-binding protein [Streptomyces sp. M19]
MRESASALCRTPVGTGPFRFADWRKKQSITLERNTRYRWAPPTAKHTGPANLPRLTIRFIQENAVRLGALNSGRSTSSAGSRRPTSGR